MKIKSLLLGSLAIAGMSGLATGAHAADLAKGVMTSLDVCDALGLSGLTISSDTDCLALSGGVSYMFDWGSFEAGSGSQGSGQLIVLTPNMAGNGSFAGAGTIPIPGSADSSGHNPTNNSWDSQMIAWLQATASADSDFGVAKAVIKLKSEQYRHFINGYGYFDGGDTGGSTVNVGGATVGAQAEKSNENAGYLGASGSVVVDTAYVSVGDSTVLTAGKAGSIVNTGDDTPLNWLGLFNAQSTGTGGVEWSTSSRAGGTINYGDGSGADIQTGNDSVQVVSSLGNGLTLAGSLEDLNDNDPDRAGTAIGVISYAGDSITAHLSVLATGILDGNVNTTAYHAGLTGTFDKFKFDAAVAGDASGYMDGLASAQITLDMFKLAASVEGTHDAAAGSSRIAGTYTGNPGGTNTPGYAGSADGLNGFGAGASASLTVSDGVTLNIGGRYFDSDTSSANNEGYQGAVSLVAAITETLTLEGDVGVYGTNSGAGHANGSTGLAAENGVYAPAGLGVPGTWYNVEYGAASVTWAPGGGFTSSVKGEAYTNGAYRATFNAAKTFQ
jgi:hypothetical protein